MGNNPLRGVLIAMAMVLPFWVAMVIWMTRGGTAALRFVLLCVAAVGIWRLITQYLTSEWRWERKRRPYTGEGVRVFLWTRRVLPGVQIERVDISEAHGWEMYPMVKLTEELVVGGQLLMPEVLLQALEQLDRGDLVLLRIRKAGMTPWEYFGPVEELNFEMVEGLWSDPLYIPPERRRDW